MTENRGATIEGTLHSVGGKGVVRMKARCETDIDDLWSALTDPRRLAHWYAKVDGDLRVGGEFTATVFGSGWDGRGRIEMCAPSAAFGSVHVGGKRRGTRRGGGAGGRWRPHDPRN